jgi:hypothetical protein
VLTTRPTRVGAHVAINHARSGGAIPYNTVDGMDHLTRLGRLYVLLDLDLPYGYELHTTAVPILLRKIL